MLKLELVELDDLNLEDMENIKLCMAVDSNGDADHIYKKLASGKAIPWRYSTPKGNVIFLLEENTDKREKYIFVWYMAGKGIVGHTQYLIDALVEYAKLRDCKSLRSFSIPRIAKYMKRFGFEEQMVSMRKEL